MEYNVRKNPFLKFHDLRRGKINSATMIFFLLSFSHSSISDYLRRIK